MKQFILKTSFFIVVTAAIFFLILSFANGSHDQFYLRYTSPQQDNLILGTSRSAQSLQPQIMNKIVYRTFYNFSFSVGQSIFGPVYLEKIKMKLNPRVKNGIHILTVDPWSISSQSEDPNDITKFRENYSNLAKTHFVNVNPNFEYLINSLSGEYYKILTKPDSTLFLHKDGWLEVSIPIDTTFINSRKKSKIKFYRKNYLPIYRFSSVRLEYLLQTIEFLKRHGKVFLVRLPVSPEMFNIEQELLPDFTEIISPAIQKADGYLDMTNENDQHLFTDGNHLYKTSGRLVSEKIANWIKAQLN